jgi:hypothetical protein
MKIGWNKKGDSNLNTECPIAASDFKIFQKNGIFPDYYTDTVCVNRHIDLKKPESFCR